MPELKVTLVACVMIVLCILACSFIYFTCNKSWKNFVMPDHRRVGPFPSSLCSERDLEFFEFHADRIVGGTPHRTCEALVLRLDFPHVGISIIPNWHQIGSLKLCLQERELDRSLVLIDTEPSPIVEMVRLARPALVLSTKLDEVREIQTSDPDIPCLYIPTYAERVSMHHVYYEDLFHQKKNLEVPRQEFCVFAYSNCDDQWKGVRDRKTFYQRLQERSGGRVKNLGRCYNTSSGGGKGNYLATNSSAFQGFKFTIAFENSPLKGYVSEKLVNAMLAKTIPIYLGAPDVAEHFNPRSFINVADFSSFDACIDYIFFLDEHPDEYDKVFSQPWMTPEQVLRRRDADRFLYSDADSYHAFLFRSIASAQPLIADCMRAKATVNATVTLVTFSDGKRFRSDRILKEAAQSQYFKRCIGCDDALPFLENHRSFVDINRRGHGYYIWKPACILKALEESSEHDIVVWLDSGSVIVPYRATTVSRWYRMLTEGGKDILLMSTGHPEVCWSKMDLITRIIPEASADNVVGIFSTHLTAQQIATSAILMKKTEAVVRLVRKWRDLAVAEQYSLIDDSPSKRANHLDFKEHRHDQSILSLLLKTQFPREKLQILSDLKDTGDSDTQPFLFKRLDGSGKHHGKYW